MRRFYDRAEGARRRPAVVHRVPRMIEPLVVHPGERARLAERDPRVRPRSRQGGGTGAARRAPRAAHDAAEPSLRGRPAQRPPRPPGARRLGEGRGHPQGVHRLEPAGLPRRLVSQRRRRPSSLTTTCGACTRRCPARGEIGIFNRSHYEDIVAVRMLGLAPEEVWRRRAGHIREWERMLVDEGTTARQGLPRRLAGGAADPPAGADRRPGEAVEVRAQRPQGARALRRVPGRLGRGDHRDLDRLGALARRPGRPQLGQGARHRGVARRGARGARPAAAAGRARHREPSHHLGLDLKEEARPRADAFGFRAPASRAMQVAPYGAPRRSGAPGRGGWQRGLAKDRKDELGGAAAAAGARPRRRCRPRRAWR